MDINFLSQFNIGNYLLSIVIGILVFIWVWQILWITKDISARTDNLFLQIISIIIAVIFLPISGLMIYFLIRPIYLKYDKNGRKEALSLKTIECNFCGNKILTDFDYCIFCGEAVKIECKECKNKYPVNRDYCDNCGAPNVVTLEE